MRKTLKKLGVEGMFFNVIKYIHDKSTANIILNGKQLKPCPQKTGMSTFSTPIQGSFGILSQSNKTKQEIRHSNREGKVKLLLYADDMILYIKDCKKAIRNHKHF
jgi:hypothetical protein